MQGFSAAGLSSTCAAIAHRALSTAVELDELQNRIDPLLLTLSARLHELHQAAEKLGERVTRASVISHTLQETLSQALGACGPATAAVEKQVKSANLATGISTVSPATWAGYESWVTLQVDTFQILQEVLARGNAASQDEMLARPDIHDNLALSEVACRATVDPGADGDDDNPPGYPDDVPEYPADVKDPALFETLPPGPSSPAYLSAPSLLSPGPSQSSKSKGLSRGLASLSESFRAMTAPFRYKPEPLVVALCEASARGNVKHVSNLLAEGANINGRDEDGKTPIVRAIEGHFYDTVKTLIDRGASKDVADSARKIPPLFWAAEAGDLPIVELLLARGCSPRDRNAYGAPYFVDTCANASLEMVRLMLDSGAEVAAKDAYGREVILHAVQNGNLPLARLLFDRGASPATRDLTNTPLVAIALQDYEKTRGAMFRLLIERGADINSQSTNGTPLVVTAMEAYDKRPEVFRMLIERGADINSASISGTPMVVDALKSGRIDLFGFLLSRGANANAKDIVGTSLLLIAIKDLKLSPAEARGVMKSLLDHGADANAVDGWGWSVMDYIFDKGMLELVPMFLQRGADPNRKSTKTGQTLLMYAIEKCNWELASQLITYGANPNVADAKGRTPLMETLRRHEFKIAEKLITHGADINKESMITPLGFATASGLDDIVRLLTARGATPDPDAVPLGSIRSHHAPAPAPASAPAAAPAPLAPSGPRAAPTPPAGRASQRTATTQMGGEESPPDYKSVTNH